MSVLRKSKQCAVGDGERFERSVPEETESSTDSAERNLKGWAGEDGGKTPVLWFASSASQH